MEVMSGDFLNNIQFDLENRLCWGNFWVKGSRKHRSFPHPSSQKDMHSVKENPVPHVAGKKATLSVTRLTECLDTKQLAVSRSCQMKSSCPEWGEFEVPGKSMKAFRCERILYCLTYLEKGPVAGPSLLTLQTLQINPKDIPRSFKTIQGAKLYLCFYRLSLNTCSFNHKFHLTRVEN